MFDQLTTRKERFALDKIHSQVIYLFQVTRIIRMKDETTSITKIIKMATNKATVATISNAISYLLSHNNTLLQKTEEIFTEIWN